MSLGFQAAGGIDRNAPSQRRIPSAHSQMAFAAGVSQVVEIVRQLRREAGARQVEGAKAGLCVNFGGFGNNVVATVLTRA